MTLDLTRHQLVRKRTHVAEKYLHFFNFCDITSVKSDKDDPCEEEFYIRIQNKALPYW